MSDLYVQIIDKKKLRENVLQSSKNTIEILKRMHYVMDLKKDKLELIKKIKGELKELAIHVEYLQKQLPQIKEEIPQIKKARPIHRKIVQKNKDLGRLQSAIEKLEGQLIKLR